MTPQKLVVLFTSLTGGAIGLFAPIGVVKWLLQTEPEDAGILTLFFFPVWCLLLGFGTLDWPQAGIASDWRQTGFAKIVGPFWCSGRSVSNYLAVAPVIERH